ncbi:hypothetical protein [Flavobacterium rhizosphaerae]|uniref:GIY-YIG domain-containing protein n=1 Tax=Flavobacterium rhizosphaerae TaxID=3163298 RepID=A0ABW8YWP9_9FLAO
MEKILSEKKVDIHSFIKNTSKKSVILLNNLIENGIKNIGEFYIDCSTLEDYNFVDIRYSDKFKDLFTKLMKFEGPCLYYFTITSGHLPQEIITEIQKYATTEASKSIPAIKSKVPNSNILYVGKVKRGMWGRLIQHLGFYKVKGTQGLQLYYWTQELKLSVKLTVLEFEPEMIDLISFFENELAKELNPILGKHK